MKCIQKQNQALKPGKGPSLLNLPQVWAQEGTVFSEAVPGLTRKGADASKRGSSRDWRSSSQSSLPGSSLASVHLQNKPWRSGKHQVWSQMASLHFLYMPFGIPTGEIKLLLKSVEFDWRDFLSPVPKPPCEQHLWCKPMTFCSGYLRQWSEKQTGEIKYDLDSVLQRNDTIQALFVFVYFCLLLFVCCLASTQSELPRYKSSLVFLLG